MRRLLSEIPSYLAVAFGGIAAVLVYLGSRDEATQLFQTKVAYVGITAYFGVTLALLAWFIISYRRKSQYAEAMSCIYDAVHEFREVSEYLEDCLTEPDQFERSKFQNMLPYALDSVVQAYNIVTGVRNRAAIYVIGGSAHETYARTLARDSKSHARNDATDRNEGQKHLVDMNTDLQAIVRRNLRYFLASDVRTYSDYATTSEEGDIRKLPYRSRLVIPVRRIADPPRIERPAPKSAHIIILGVLAIDAKARRVYHPRYDLEMGSIVADAIYPVLRLWQEVEGVAMSRVSILPPSDLQHPLHL